MPGLVGEVRVGRDAIHLDAEILEHRVVVSQITQFGRTHEGEIGRVEHDDRPLAFEVLVADRDELAVVVRGGLERNDFGVDERHESDFLRGK